MAFDRYDSAGLANAGDLRAVRIWDVAAHAGKRVGVINVPPSYPLRPIPNGYLVSCMLTPPGAAFTEPPEVAGELGEYEIDLPPPKNLRRSDPDYHERALTYLQGMRRQTRLRAEATARVMAARPSDGVCVVFYAPDRVQHYFWEYVDPEHPAPGGLDDDVRAALLAVYDELDQAIGRLVDAAGPDANVVLLSDHGFGTKPERSVRVNRWLANQGLLRRHAFWTTRRRVVRKVFPASWRARYDTLDHILVNRARSRAWSEALFTGTAGIWVHVRGRYPLGCVAPGAEYERVRDQILRGLGALTDDSGRRVFHSVQRREDVYRGPYVGDGARPRRRVRSALRDHLREPAARAAHPRAVRTVRGARVHGHPRSGRASTSSPDRPRRPWASIARSRSRRRHRRCCTSSTCRCPRITTSP